MRKLGRYMLPWVLALCLLAPAGLAETDTRTSPMNMLVSRAESRDLQAMPEAARARKDTIVLGVQSLDGVFNPLFAKTQGDMHVTSMLFDELLFADEYGTMGDGFARLSISEDGRTYTFDLPHKATFADGTPVTAADFVNTLYLLLMPGYDGGYDISRLAIDGVDAYLSGEATEIVGIRLANDTQFVIELTQPNPSAVAYLALPALSVAHYGDCKRPATAATQEGRDAFYISTLARIRKLDGDPMGYGQYDLARYEVGVRASFDANLDYWRAKPSTLHFEILTVPLGGELDAMLQGVVDIIGTYSSIEVISDAYKSKFISIYSWKGDVFGYLGMRADTEVFQDARVRQAFAMGLDRAYVLQSTLERYANLPGMVLFDSFAELSDVLGEKYPMDITKAAELLDTAGWTKGADGLRAKDGKPFTFTFAACSDNPVSATLVEAMERMTQELGLTMKVDLLPFAEHTKAVEVGTYDMYFQARMLPTHPAIAADFFMGKSHLNQSGFDSEGLERFMNWAAREGDESRQSVIYEGLYQELYLELPFIPIYRRSELLLVNGRVRNLYISSAHSILSDAYRLIILETLPQAAP